MNNSMVGYVALAVQSFVIFMALSENGGDIMSLSQKSPRPCLRQNGATTGVTIPERVPFACGVCR